MPTINPFTPQTNGTVGLVASTGSSVIQLAAGTGTQVRVINTGSLTCYIEFGASTIVASAGSSMPILSMLSTASTGQIFTIPGGGFAPGLGGSVASTATTGQYAIAIASVTTTGGLFFTRGEGF